MIPDARTAGYVRQFLETEDEPLRAARARSEEADLPAVATETGALLRWLVRLCGAQTIAEVGTGGGYSGLWLLGGAGPKAVLTTIEVDQDARGLAQRAFAEAGVNDRVRSILGPGLQVLGKLADATYDLVFIDALKSEYPDYLEHARRLLRPGGLVVADNVLWGGHVADDTQIDDDTEGLRRFNQAILDDPALHQHLSVVGDGVLAAVYVPEAE